MFTHELIRDTYTSVLQLDTGLPFICLTCVDNGGEEIGSISLQEWQVEETLGYEPSEQSDLDSVINTLERHIFG